METQIPQTHDHDLHDHEDVSVYALQSHHEQTLRVFLNIITVGKLVLFCFRFLLLTLIPALHTPLSLLLPSDCAPLLLIPFHTTTHLLFPPSTKE